MKARQIDCEYLYYSIDDNSAEIRNAMCDSWDKVFIVDGKGYAPRMSKVGLWGIDDYISPSAIQFARQLSSVRRYDIVIVNYVWSTALSQPFRAAGSKIVLDTHDVFGNRREVMTNAGLDPHWFYTSPDQEAIGLARADVILAIQEQERKVLQEITNVPVEVLEFAIKTKAIPRPSVTANGKIVVGYLASVNPWNLNSLRSFDRLIFNSSRRDELLSRFKFRCYGGIARAGNGYHVFETMPHLDELGDIYRDVDLMINPMIGGTGLKIKTLESLAFGCPIFSTIDGGIGVEHLHPCLRLGDLSVLLGHIEAIENRSMLNELSAELLVKYAEFYSDVQLRAGAILRRVLPEA